MSDVFKIGFILALPIIALIELFVISLVISVLDCILDDIGDLMKTIANLFGGDKT